MSDEELGMLDKLLETHTPRAILQGFSDVLERRASSVLDAEETPEESARQDALSFLASSRSLRQFAVRA